MTGPGNYRRAVKVLTGQDLIVCPKCSEQRQITKEQDGSYSCAVCATNFRSPDESA